MLMSFISRHVMCLEMHVACINKNQPLRHVTGNNLTFTKGNNKRDQIDSIDLSTTPNFNFKHLLACRDYVIKLCLIIPLTLRTEIVVACIFLKLFSILGPPCLLDPNNVPRFIGASTRASYISVSCIADESLEKTGNEIKNILSNTCIVNRLVRRSKKNEGNKRYNFQIQRKLTNWIEG